MTASSDIDELTRAWAVLSPPATSEFASFPLTVSANGAPCRVALDRQARRHLLVPAPRESLVPDGRPSVLTSVVRPLSFGGEAVAHVDICCTEPDLDPEFDDVVSDLLEQVDGSSAPGAATLAGLARWRRLFRSRLERGMTEAVRVGLFAELSALQALVLAGAAPSVDVWSGPLGQPHDFEASTGCVEVKASAATEPVRINGLRQLDLHDDRTLELVVLAVVPDPDGTTLSDLVGVVRTLVHDEAGFDDRLRRLGWRTPTVADTQPLAVTDVLRVPVTTGMPSIVPAALVTGSLPTGVSALSYCIDRDVLVAHSVPGGLPEMAASVAP